MQFSVGDKVVHPGHGPGEILRVERRDLLAGAKWYYVIEIPGQGLTLHVPESQLDEIGIRPAMSQDGLERMLDTLRDPPRMLPGGYSERQEEIRDRLKSGHAEQVAEAVRDLSWHRDQAHLTKVDESLLRQGRDMLAAEVALVTGTGVAEAERVIDQTLVADA